MGRKHPWGIRNYVSCLPFSISPSAQSLNKDDNVLLTPVVPMSLEKAIDFIRDDELVEVTPSCVRIRKRVLQANKR